MYQIPFGSVPQLFLQWRILNSIDGASDMGVDARDIYLSLAATIMSTFATVFRLYMISALEIVFGSGHRTTVQAHARFPSIPLNNFHSSAGRSISESGR